MNKFIVLLILQVGASNQAYAFVIGGSNLGLLGYPSHDCVAPVKPYKPYSFTDEYAVNSYNSSVEIYNMDLESYIDCINTYVENANNDIQRIRDAANSAISEAEVNL